MKLYEALERCVDYLTEDADAPAYTWSKKHDYSCNTIFSVARDAYHHIDLDKERELHERFEAFMEMMHVDKLRDQFEDAFPDGVKRQQARALWLTWAAMMAKEWDM